MKEKIVMHADIDHCYAQIEEMKFPALRDVPMAVGGHEEKRHGIILAKNDLAKKAGVKTGESLREAYDKCPQLLIIPPSYDDYTYYTSLVKDIYGQYSDRVESFGLDEAWIDLTDSGRLIGDEMSAAEKIQQRVLREIGLTVSIGVSYNKVFAKFGSDLRKPFGITHITRQNYRQLVWPRPVQDLLYVGPATNRKLHSRGILTVGELACYPVSYLKEAMGAAGVMIHAFANGEDPSEVAGSAEAPPVKSVGNAMTLIHDVVSAEEIRPVCFVLAESVASRLRDHGMEASLVSVSVRRSDMTWNGCQQQLGFKTDVSEELLEAAMRLLERCCDFSVPIRAVGITAGSLSPARHGRQLDLFVDEETHDRRRCVDIVMDRIRGKYGFYAVRRACMMVDEPLTSFNPKGDHTIHPIGYFQGRKMVV